MLRDVASVRADGGLALALGGCSLRNLFKPEVAQLESQGNTAEDWLRVRVAIGFHPRRVRNCEFRGDVVLGEFKQRVRLVDGVGATRFALVAALAAAGAVAVLLVGRSRTGTADRARTGTTGPQP